MTTKFSNTSEITKPIAKRCSEWEFVKIKNIVYMEEFQNKIKDRTENSSIFLFSYPSF